MNGAESLVRTLVAGGVDVCFANPGTSWRCTSSPRWTGSRHALRARRSRAWLTGAADGYYR